MTNMFSDMVEYHGLGIALLLMSVMCLILFTICYLIYTAIENQSITNDLNNLIKTHDCQGLKLFGENHPDFIKQVFDANKLEGCKT